MLTEYHVTRVWKTTEISDLKIGLETAKGCLLINVLQTNFQPITVIQKLLSIT